MRRPRLALWKTYRDFWNQAERPIELLLSTCIRMLRGLLWLFLCLWLKVVHFHFLTDSLSPKTGRSIFSQSSARRSLSTLEEIPLTSHSYFFSLSTSWTKAYIKPILKRLRCIIWNDSTQKFDKQLFISILYIWGGAWGERERRRERREKNPSYTAQSPHVRITYTRFVYKSLLLIATSDGLSPTTFQCPC